MSATSNNAEPRGITLKNALSQAEQEAIRLELFSEVER